MKLLDSIVTEAASIVAVRRDIHAHPELCFQEVRTADVVAAKLTEWGIPVHRGLGGTGGGAREMIKDGLFEKFPVEAVFGMHNWPGGPVGRFAVSPGPVMASTAEFKVTVRGKGGHGAMPHLGTDPVPIACQVVQAFQTIVSRNMKPIDAGVVSVTMVHAGEATNVIPDSCELQGTVRAFREEVQDLIAQRMKQIAENICAAHDARCEF